MVAMVEGQRGPGEAAGYKGEVINLREAGEEQCWLATNARGVRGGEKAGVGWAAVAGGGEVDVAQLLFG